MADFDLQAAIRACYPRIHRAALVMTGNPWDADDLAQETFLEAARSADRFAGNASVYTWVYAILLNRERRWRRRNRTWRRWLRNFYRERGRRNADRAERALEVEQWRQSLWRHVSRLPDAQRHVVVLRYSEGLSYEQIASLTQTPLGTVKSRLHHALKALRRRLTESQPEITWSVDQFALGEFLP